VVANSAHAPFNRLWTIILRSFVLLDNGRSGYLDLSQ